MISPPRGVCATSGMELDAVDRLLDCAASRRSARCALDAVTT